MLRFEKIYQMALLVTLVWGRETSEVINLYNFVVEMTFESLIHSSSCTHGGFIHGDRRKKILETKLIIFYARLDRKAV